jgi:hypothetical protein
VTDRPILFSAPMVQALLAGTKTQTRRVVTPQPPDWVSCYNERLVDAHFWCEHDRDDDSMRHWPSYEHGLPCPYGAPGDRLWVRETWGPCDGGACYRASERDGVLPDGGRWHPSIHMPRWASRITLEVTDVRVERLQDISEADAIADGVKHSQRAVSPSKADPCWWDYLQDEPNYRNARDSYASLWEKINGAGSWDANPWVWVIEFRRI